jgi:hypothetical protein
LRPPIALSCSSRGIIDWVIRQSSGAEFALPYMIGLRRRAMLRTSLRYAALTDDMAAEEASIWF